MLKNTVGVNVSILPKLPNKLNRIISEHPTYALKKETTVDIIKEANIFILLFKYFFEIYPLATSDRIKTRFVINNLRKMFIIPPEAILNTRGIRISHFHDE